MTALWASVPKASINKYRNIVLIQHDVRSPWEIESVQSPPFDPRTDQGHTERSFGRFIVLPTDRRHRSGPKERNVAEKSARQRLLEAALHKIPRLTQQPKTSICGRPRDLNSYGTEQDEAGSYAATQCAFLEFRQHKEQSLRTAERYQANRLWKCDAQ